MFPHFFWLKNISSTSNNKETKQNLRVVSQKLHLLETTLKALCSKNVHKLSPPEEAILLALSLSRQWMPIVKSEDE